ncbi:hypothetical protein AX15_004894 [Amanita polypyramis BW_CC]|nr:hypothetical protein AX15_004894 [Amanita polypyramis BW_CC]
MVGYIQSRGRARNKTSTFVIMIQENDSAQLARYKALKEGEPQVARVYLARKDDLESEESDEEELSPLDIPERERYVVPQTGAILNYDNALGLLNRLCALIRTDHYTPAPNPVYKGDFAVTLQLPSSLPLLPEQLVYHGPHKRSKKEAKRAVAFLAARHLHELDVFDEYLLPVPSAGLDNVDANEDESSSKSKVLESLTVMVRDPWVMGPRLWIHELVLHGRRVAGLVTGTRFSLDHMRCLSISIGIRAGLPVRFHGENELHQRRAMEKFTKLGIQYRLTGSPIRSPLSVFLVPVTNEGQPDFEAIGRLLDNPRGSSDWSSISEEHYTGLLVVVKLYSGRSYRLRRLRHDITPLSRPTLGSREENYASYRDYIAARCMRRFEHSSIPTEGPMAELELLPRTVRALYDLKYSDMVPTVHDGGLFPLAYCRWIDLSPDLYQTFELLPAICHRLTDIYRSVCLRSQIGLPPINNSLLVEALTLPSAHAGYSNQRLETLGDAVLGLCTTIHLFKCYPHRHEGQLTTLRRAVVSNRFLSGRALAFGLEQFLTNETFTAGRWRHTLPEGDNGWISTPARYVKRKIPRRGLQDCMEAILGASFLSGGIPMALSAGRALGLTLGGAEACYMESSVSPIKLEPGKSSYFAKLENSLGYRFYGSQILLEAVTHPSFSLDSGGRSYQRLEFFGDAILSLAVMEHLYTRFKEATSHQLSLLRSKLVCNAALAWVAVKRLELHKILLANSVDLNIAIGQYVPILGAASAEDIIEMGWRYDPPKALSDVFESVIGAVFVDSAYNYEKTASMIILTIEDLLSVLKPDVSENPVSKLLLWTASQGCQKVAFEEVSSLQGKRAIKGMTVTVHGGVVAGPITTASHRTARFEASKIALEYLMDDEGEKSLKRLCVCKRATMVDNDEEMAEEEEVASMLTDI